MHTHVPTQTCVGHGYVLLVETEAVADQHTICYQLVGKSENDREIDD